MARMIKGGFRTVNGTISAITISGSTLTVTVPSTAGLQNGYLVAITGSGMTNVDGSYNISSLTATSFKATDSSPSGTYGGSGTWTGGNVYRNINLVNTGVTVKSLPGLICGGFVANLNSSSIR